MTEQSTTDESAPQTPPGDRWDVSYLPPEPGPGQAVWDAEGTPWVRMKTAVYGRRWSDGVRSIAWAKLLVEHGPLVRLVPADERDELLRTVDSLRNTLSRYRGTPAIRDAAKALVAHQESVRDVNAVTDKRGDQLVSRLRVALEDVEPVRPRTVTYDRSAIVDGMAADAGIPERSMLTERRRAVVKAARRVHDCWSIGQNWPVPADRWSDLHDALVRLDEHVAGTG